MTHQSDSWIQLLGKLGLSEEQGNTKGREVVKGMILYLAQAYENALEDGINPEIEQIRECVRQKDYHLAFEQAESFYQRANPCSSKSLLDTVLELPELL